MNLLLVTPRYAPASAGGIGISSGKLSEVLGGGEVELIAGGVRPSLIGADQAGGCF
jgi:hypothetical protein